MTGSVALDIAIGFVFNYLLYPLFAIIVQPAKINIATFRVNVFQKATIRMLDEGNADVASGCCTSFGYFLGMFGKRKNKKLNFSKAFCRHPLIKYFAKDDYQEISLYLTELNFPKILIDLSMGNDFSERLGVQIFREIYQKTMI